MAAVLRRKGETRKERQALTVEEAYRLLAAAGPRKLRYAFHLWTGLRMSQAAGLEWRDLDLDQKRPSIRVRADVKGNKAKRAVELPLHPNLADALRDARPPFAQPTDRVFEATPTLRSLKGYWRETKKKGKVRQKGDLERAGIPFADDQGRTFDFHAMRKTFNSWLVAAGVSETVRKQLMQHSPKSVTDRHYLDFGVVDLWGEIRKLPPIRLPAEAEAVRATGTDGQPAAPPQESVAYPVALRTGPERPGVAGSDRETPTECYTKDHVSTYENRDFSASEALEPTGFEPATSWLQTRRSPN